MRGDKEDRSSELVWDFEKSNNIVWSKEGKKTRGSGKGSTVLQMWEGVI